MFAKRAQRPYFFHKPPRLAVALRKPRMPRRQRLPDHIVEGMHNLAVLNWMDGTITGHTKCGQLPRAIRFLRRNRNRGSYNTCRDIPWKHQKNQVEADSSIVRPKSPRAE